MNDHAAHNAGSHDANAHAGSPAQDGTAGVHDSEEQYTVTTHDKLRPLELIGISAVLAIFAGAIVAFVTKEWATLVPIAAGGVFIVSLLVLALLMLAIKPNKQDLEARAYLDEKSAEGERKSRGH